uniref:Reverse transcriptase zinc-binding domain-containing protein n=1 Tax=Lactuca sativa TaxID=4236 RepID=A0A9R1ULU5_LACSA|nr:hypothetical protein LSAT_V11C800442390 [Lactuca sativa]
MIVGWQIDGMLVDGLGDGFVNYVMLVARLLNEGFAGNNTKKYIDSIILQEGEEGMIGTRWCRFVPIKLNIHIWRTIFDRVPTHPISMLCPLCSTQIEECNHVFVGCCNTRVSGLSIFFNLIV